MSVANCPTLTSISMSLKPGANPHDGDDGVLDGKTDISPNCYSSTLELSCPTVPAPNMGAVEEWYYTSDVSYPTGVQLNGVPPASGWIFSHTSCCRNPSTNVTGATSDSWFLRAVMFPYQGTNMFPCYDNSPVFAEIPSTVICTGYPFTYNHNATDKELDCLMYEWAPALDGSISTPVSYAAGYSYNNPLPGTTQNANNVPATVDPYTGEISYTSFTSGAFVTVTKVTAYRNSIKIAEIYREMQIVLLACPVPNNKPDVSPPFLNPLTGVYELYVDTVYAGDVIDFDITALDMDVLPTGMPNTIFLESSSLNYGTGYTSTTTGCVNPPCATLTPAPPLNAMVALATHFHWQTSCDHLSFSGGCGNTPGNVHTFYFKIYDNGCPANAINGVTVTIVLLPPPIIDPPKIHCTEVLPNGDVTLTWTIPPDPRGTFNSYHIFTADNPAGPFIKIDSIFTYGQNTYTHIGANALNGPRYYYATSRSSCYGAFYSVPCDTVASMHLDVTPVGGGQIAQLDWNPVSNPLLPSSSNQYQIYREYPIGTWTLLDSTTNLTYLDTVTVCNDSLNYRIEIGDMIGCTSVSSPDGATLADGFPPITPVMDTVSVSRITGEAEMSWQPSPSQDTRKYYIYRRTGGGPWFIVDSVFGINNTYYTYLASDPQTGPESYCVAAVDSCNQPSPMGTEHRTIHLKPITLDACADKIMLSWTRYINMGPAVAGYRVFMSEDGSPFTVLATLGPADTTYTQWTFTVNANYCYYIQAFNSDGETSSSNEQCVVAIKPNQPRFVFMRYATVVDNQYVKVAFFVDTTAYITRYELERSDDGITYTPLATIPASTLGSTIVYEDHTAFVNAQSYYYRAIVVDSCNVPVLTSNEGRTIFLEGNTETFLQNELQWNPYEDRDVLEYSINRQVEDYDAMHILALTSPGSVNYIDDVSAYTESGGRFYYRVDAPMYDLFLSQYPFADTVSSNMILLLQEPRVYIPTAFTPLGFNPVFAPVGVFTDTEEYYMGIYDRWGEKLFESFDVNQGWNGTYQGKVCHLGSYVYFIRFKLPTGKYYEKLGSVILLR